VPGVEAQLTYRNVGRADWTPDGAGIVIEDSAGCINILPAAGGSAIWQGCDTRGSFGDSTHAIDDYSVGPGGRVLFSTHARDRKWDNLGLRTALDPYIFAHGDLWISDTGSFTAAHKVLALYSDVVAPLTAGPSGFMTVDDVAWLGPSEFVGMGSVLTFNNLFGPLQLLHGTITTSGVTLTPIVGADGASTGAITGAGTRFVVITGSLSLGAIPIGGGAITPFGTVPAAAGRNIVGVSCQATRCAVLTQEAGNVAGGVISTVWSVPSTGGAAQPGKSFPHAIGTASISPAGGNALTIEGGKLFLLSNVLP
jgi:hypothetical protein